jgi:hypothetical protein
MISLLLDHPWPLSAVLDRESPAFGVLTDFESLTRRHRLAPVPFISAQDLAVMWLQLESRNNKTAAFATLKRMANGLLRESDAPCSATPVPEPPELTVTWKCALRDSIAEENWRSPQIVVPLRRELAWHPGDEVEVRFDECDGYPALEPTRRVLVPLQSYDGHPFALSDRDPWNLRHVHPVPPNVAANRRHPCSLPKPPCLEGIPVEELLSALNDVRAFGWVVGEKRYFMPPANWSPENRNQNAWRAGHAFPRALAGNRNRVGYLDYRGIIWVWDEGERHWDVQTEPYLRVTCTGDVL